MKKTTLMMLSMLFILVFSNQSYSQTDSTCAPGYTYGGWVVVDTIICYQVKIEYCYMYDKETNNIKLDYKNTIYTKLYEDCNVPDLTAYLDEHFDELLEKHTERVLAKLAEKVELGTVFCNEGEYNMIEVALAGCFSTELITWYGDNASFDPDDPSTWVLVPHYWRPACAEESKCISIYKICWYWDGTSPHQQCRLTLIDRIADINQTCPPTKVFDVIGMPHPVEVPCKTLCD